MEWETVVVAGLGIAGSVTAGSLPAWLAWRLSRRERRAEVYVETLATLWIVHENAQTLSAIPGAELGRPPVERLRQLDAEVRLLGGRAVRDQLRVAIQLANRFDRELFLPQLRARLQAGERERAPRGDQEETAAAEERRMVKEGREELRALEVRMALGEVADQLGRAIVKLEELMRAEVG